MDFALTEQQEMIRKEVATLAGSFSLDYWLEKDRKHEYPWDFVKAFARAGWLGAIIPEAYGGSGLGVTEAAIMLHEICAAGAGTSGASPIHFYMFPPMPVIKHGSEPLKQKYLPKIATGEIVMSFGVTEPNVGTDTSRIQTRAVKQGDRWVVNGRKVWNTNARNATHILLLARTGERMGIQPQVGRSEDPLRWNWDSPFIISPHSHTRLYFAADKMFRSDDRGDSWQVLSGQLSRGLDRDKLAVMGKIWSIDAVAKNASTAFFGNASALAESPGKEGLIYIGTDDGLLQITEDGGKSWRRVDKISDIPELAYVSRIVASNHDVNTVYVAFENRQNADFKPYLLKSTDAGRTWTSIKSNLPANHPVWSIAEDHVNRNLLFVGTEFGLFFTIDGGQKWVQLKGGLPTIQVRDLNIQRRENDLVVGTFGRGIYILDNYSALRSLTPEMLKQEALLFPVKGALMYIQAQPIGGRGKSFQGESYYTAENPPFGATFTYYLKDALKTKKEKRQEAEKDATKKGVVLSMPNRSDLSAEEEEEAPAIIFTVTDSSGHVVRRLTGPITAGVQRVAWDLRYPPASLPPPPNPETEDPFNEGPAGPLVMPGTYRVSVARRVDGMITPIGQPQEFQVVVEGQENMSASDRAALVEFQQKVARLQRAVNGALEAANALKPRLAAIRRALLETPSASEALLADATTLDKRTNDILRALRGDNALRVRNMNLPPSIAERVGDIVGGQRMSTSRPTQTHMNQYVAAAQDFETTLAQLRQLIEGDLLRLEKQMEAAGAPWTPGRIPEWKPEP